MADKGQLEILWQGAKAWNQWRAEHPGVRPDLTCADISHARLRDTDLRGAILRGADLSHADLSDADLSHANLSGSDLTAANLPGANLINAYLHGAKISRVYLGTGAFRERGRSPDRSPENEDTEKIPTVDFSGADLTDADLTDAQLRNADLRGANLSNASLSDANLSNVRLDGATLSSADLGNANLTGADLTRANFNDVIWGDTLLDLAIIGSVMDVIRNSSLHKAPWHRAFVGAEFQKYSEDNPNWLTRRDNESLIDRVLELIRFEVGAEPSILRYIEFPPEYHEAGVSILSYFASILRDKYPNTQVGVTITQEGRKVTMAIETPEGQREEIEQTLEEYGLVVTGEKPVEEFVADPVQAAELRGELRLMQARLENKNELLTMKNQLIEHQRVDIGRLQALIATVAQRPAPEVHVPAAPISITVNPVIGATATADVHQTFHLLDHLPSLKANLQEAAKALPDKDRQQLLSAGAELVQLDSDADKEKAGAALSKLHQWVIDLGDEKTKVGKTLKDAKKGLEIAQRITRHYNSIAQWCGMPVVPEPLLGKKAGGD